MAKISNAAERQMKHEAMRIRLEKEAQERQNHKSQCEIKYGLVGHSKANKLYELAWEYGHSEGFYSVEQYYGEFSELLK